MATGPKITYEFGPFRVDPDKQVILRGDQPLAVTPKAFETLLVLLRHGREAVSKEELMKAVWPDAFVEEANLSQNIFVLRKALGDTPEDKRYIVTLPGRGYRFAAEVRTVAQDGEDVLIERHLRAETVFGGTTELDREPIGKMVARTTEAICGPAGIGWKKIAATAAAVVLVILLGADFFWHRSQQSAVAAKGFVLVADFTNTTGDPVFDGTLRQGVTVQLEQSPYFNFISDSQIAETLRLMEQPEESRITNDVAREICQRRGAAAVIGGSIALLGPQYVLGLNAFNCRTGESLGAAQVTAENKAQVLSALAQAASQLRGSLGESVASIQKYNVPLEQATTSSLEALQAFTLGRLAMGQRGDWASGVTLLERAVSLDPNFAMAYARLAACYENLGEREKAAENVTKAFQLIGRTSEREKIYITGHYNDFVTGDLLKVAQTYELGSETFPQDVTNYITLAAAESEIGDCNKEIAASRDAERVAPDYGLSYQQEAIGFVCLGRLDKAKAIVDDSAKKGIETSEDHLLLYKIDSLKDDAPAMAKEVEWATGKPGYEDKILFWEAMTASSKGALRSESELTRRAILSAQHSRRTETAALYEAEAGFDDALFGYLADARNEADGALRLSNGRDVGYFAALDYEMAGDTKRGEMLAEDLAKRFPDDTIVQFVYAPTIEAVADMARGQNAKAVRELQTCSPYEFALQVRLVPSYFRGEALLREKDASAAQGEFQRILDHASNVRNTSIWALAHLEMARGYALAGDGAKAKAAYQDFSAIWKSGDKDAPIMRKAQEEYANL